MEIDVLLALPNKVLSSSESEINVLLRALDISEKKCNKQVQF